MAEQELTPFELGEKAAYEDRDIDKANPFVPRTESWINFRRGYYEVEEMREIDNEPDWL